MVRPVLGTFGCLITAVTLLDVARLRGSSPLAQLCLPGIPCNPQRPPSLGCSTLPQLEHQSWAIPFAGALSDTHTPSPRFCEANAPFRALSLFWSFWSRRSSASANGALSADAAASSRLSQKPLPALGRAAGRGPRAMRRASSRPPHDRAELHGFLGAEQHASSGPSPADCRGPAGHLLPRRWRLHKKPLFRNSPFHTHAVVYRGVEGSQQPD